MDTMKKYCVTDEDVAAIYELLDRMKAKYGDRYKDMLRVLFDLTEVKHD